MGAHDDESLSRHKLLALAISRALKTLAFNLGTEPPGTRDKPASSTTTKGEVRKPTHNIENN